MSNSELAKTIHQIKELQRMQEELAAELETLVDTVKAEMTAQNVDTLVVDVYKVRWTVVKSSRVDTTALKREMPELAERYTKISESRRFTIS